jgi:hypothetical protein
MVDKSPGERPTRLLEMRRVAARPEGVTSFWKIPYLKLVLSMAKY